MFGVYGVIPVAHKLDANAYRDLTFHFRPELAKLVATQRIDLSKKCDSSEQMRTKIFTLLEVLRSVVFNATDAAGLRQKLLTDGFSLLKHDAKASKELLDDDQLIGGLKLGIKPEIIVISSAEIVFAE